MHFKKKGHRLFKVGQVEFDGHAGSSLLRWRNDFASFADFNNGAFGVAVFEDANGIFFVNSADATAQAPLASKK
jgi:hypothetical protein